MNDFEERQERRKERLEEASRRARRRASEHHGRADEVFDRIPLGQPIMGEDDRRRRERARGQVRRGIKEERRAQELKRRADAVGRGGVSSDDPEAVEKLKSQVVQTRRKHRWAKAVNRAWRREGKPEATDLDGWKKVATRLTKSKAKPPGLPVERVTLEHLKEAMRGVAPGYSWLQPYDPSRYTQKIRRLESRIEELQQIRRMDDGEVLGSGPAWGGWQVYVDPESNRVVFESQVKPDEEARKLLKSNAFKWSRGRRAWVRKITPRAVAAGRWVVQELSVGVGEG